MTPNEEAAAVIYKTAVLNEGMEILCFYLLDSTPCLPPLCFWPTILRHLNS